MAVFDGSTGVGSASEYIQRQSKLNLRKRSRTSFPIVDSTGVIADAFIQSLLDENWFISHQSSNFSWNPKQAYKNGEALLCYPPEQLELVSGLKHISASHDYKVVGFGVSLVQLYKERNVMRVILVFDEGGSGGISIDLIQLLR